MMLAVGLLLAQAVPVEPVGEAVGVIFIDACIRGELRLSPSRAEIIERRKLPERLRDNAPGGGWGAPSRAPIKTLTIVKINDPPSTYVFMATYDVEKPRRFNPASSCTVISRSISFHQAEAVFLRAHPSSQLGTPEWPGPLVQRWRYMAAEEGYALFLKAVQPHWIALETISFPPERRPLPTTGNE